MPKAVTVRGLSTSTPPPNIAKGRSYAEAWMRIRNANENGYYFESVTICESLISDRLLSFATAVFPKRKLNTATSLHQLIQSCNEAICAHERFNTEDARSLLEKLDLWRISRNSVVHGIAKSAPGTPTADLELFLKQAEETAKAGTLLARAVLNWHQKTY